MEATFDGIMRLSLMTGSKMTHLRPHLPPIVVVGGRTRSMEEQGGGAGTVHRSHMSVVLSFGLRYLQFGGIEGGTAP